MGLTNGNFPSAHVIYRSVVVLFFRFLGLEIVIAGVHGLSRIFIILIFPIDGTSSVVNNAEIFSDLTIELLNIAYVIYLFLNWLCEYYVIQPRGVIVKKGILRTKEYDYAIQTIQSIGVIQGILGKVFNYGTIRLYNPVLKEEILLTEVPSPYHFAKLIEGYHPSSETVRFLPKER